jgi:(p)ppGpp synthase/HD superfamily hydrolase
VEYHRRQPRKGSGTPYVGHLLTVAGYVLEDEGSEDEAIAALLHDALEDQYRDDLPTEMREDFGPKVLEIVQGLSQERLPGEQLSWRERKQRYIDHLEHAPDSVVRVSLADKLANGRSMLRDHRAEGDCLWERFNAPGPLDILWYYESLGELYARLRAGAMAEEFAHEVERLRAVVRGSAPGRSDE